jgi:hypothetical protein
MPDRDVRLEAERRLFVASALLAVRTHILGAVSDPSSFSDEGSLRLAMLCTERVTRELVPILPPDSAFWDVSATISTEDLEAGLGRRGPFPPDPDGAEAHLVSDWSAPARIIASAAAAVAGRPDSYADLHRTVDDLAVAMSVEADLETMHHDLLVGRLTFPIAFVARAAAIPLRPWPVPERVLGALVLTRSLEPILDVAADRLRSSRAGAEALGLDTLASFVEDASDRLRDRRAGLIASDGRPVPDDPGGRPTPLLRVSEPTLPRALAMARASLIADPTFRESWETHREGMFGADEVSSRFPVGLILAWLGDDGLDLPGSVDDFLSFTVANRFRYYDHPWSGVDSDTIGVALRLLARARDPERHRRAVQAVLSCVDRQVARDGAIAVWVTDCDPPSDAPPDLVALGEDCATVAGHLLLGLLASPGAWQRRTITVGARTLLQQLSTVGIAANANYPPAYALATLFRTVDTLQKASLGPDIDALLPATRHALDGELDRALRRTPTTPQEAALLTIACRDAGRLERVDAGWEARILRGQRSDGSWPGEPFAPEPDRGGWVTWYSSSLVTTALCRSALLAHATLHGSRGPALRA